MKYVGVFCVGNIFRSVTAEHFLQRELEKLGSKAKVFSAGLSVYGKGEEKWLKAHPHVQKHLRSKDFHSVSLHQAKPLWLVEDKVQEADFLFTTTVAQKLYLIDLLDNKGLATSKVFTLKGFASGKEQGLSLGELVERRDEFDIKDLAFDSPEKDYQAAFKEIEECCRKTAEKIVKGAVAN